MIIEVFKFKQNRQEYLSFIIPFSKLESISKVLVYQQDEDGYQRKPNDIHINKIKNFIVNDINGFKLPTSIILGIDEKEVLSYIKTKENRHFLDLDKIQKTPFRIVDGQHRILGMSKALEDPKANGFEDLLKKYPFNIISVITPENSRSIELDIFIDINSKGKKVSTDLAELARYNYEVKEKKLVKDIPNISDHIAMKTSQELRENDLGGIWYYAIKFDIHSSTNLGIIGVSAFRKSITGIIQKYLSKIDHKLLQLDDQELIDKCDEYSKIIKEFISKCWSNSVKEKWPTCFKENTMIDDFDNIVKVVYSNDYYIQKPLGAKSINKIIENSVDSTNTLEEAYEHFNDVIISSNVKNETWKVGGTFSGLNSEGGFKKIREMINNERPIPLN